MRRRGALSWGFSPHSRKPRRTASTASAMVTIPRISSGETSSGWIIVKNSARSRKTLSESFDEAQDERRGVSIGLMISVHDEALEAFRAFFSYLSDCRRDLRSGD